MQTMRRTNTGSSIILRTFPFIIPSSVPRRPANEVHGLKSDWVQNDFTTTTCFVDFPLQVKNEAADRRMLASSQATPNVVCANSMSR